MYVYSLGEDTPSSSCWSDLHAWALDQIWSSLAWYEKLAVNRDQIGEALGAPGSAFWTKLVDAVRQSADATVAELKTRTTISSNAESQIRNMYPTIRAKVDACTTVAQTTTPAPADGGGWWDDEAKLAQKKKTTPSGAGPAPIPEPEVAQAGIFWPVALGLGILWFVIRK